MRLTESGAIKLSVGLFLLSEIMAGPIRYYSFNHGVPFVIYLPKTEMMLVALILALTGRLRSLEFFMIGAFFLVYGFVAGYQLLSPPQIWFAAWTMVPFLFSVIAARYVFSEFEDYRKMFAWLYAVTVFGVLLNYFHEFPWSYGSFVFVGHAVQSARSWATGGFVRLGGFGRASYNAASQSLILAIFVAARRRSRLLQAGVWLLTGAVIVLTTAKGVLLAYAIVVGYGVSRDIVRYLKPLVGWTTYSFFNIAICVIAVVMVVLPFLAASQSISIDPHTTLGLLLFQSFSTRLTQTWPEALQLLTSTTTTLFGNGLGSIGAGQAFVLDSNPNTADNVFVFLDVQYGMIFSLACLGAFVLKIVVTNVRDDPSGFGRVIVSLGLLLLTYGCLSNELEDGFLATAIGFCLAYRRRWVDAEPFEAIQAADMIEAI